MAFNIELFVKSLEKNPDKKHSLDIKKIGEIENILKNKGIEYEIIPFGEIYKLIINGGGNERQNIF